MEFNLPETGTGLLGAFTAVVVVAAMWVRKLKPDLAVGDKVAAIAAADTGIVERLEKECNRLSQQNDILADKVNQFQMQLLDLTTENAKLHREVCAMREENADLRAEIRELTQKLKDSNRDCDTCQLRVTTALT